MSMRIRGRGVLVLGGVVTLAVTAACGRSGAETGETRASGYSHRLAKSTTTEVVELDDGRRVGMHYDPGRGLVEQHYSPRAKGWSKPQLIYKTRTSPCQSIALRAFGDTVAAIANFGLYCADGEPPTESIAAVGAKSLARWDTNVTKDFDGWDKATAKASGDAQELSFTSASIESVTRLRWNRTEGFSDVEEIPR
ncbi:hypothetical protein [Streptomyces sp. 8N706]|uniref:hypothetical protein n=1 Tax=Streptomyces sp. 8N706 TaxID=3457416 RepID=UPI003FD49752